MCLRSRVSGRWIDTEIQRIKEGGMSEHATELEWLKWFAINADFGSAHGDVMNLLQERFKRETGKEVPDGWKYE